MSCIFCNLPEQEHELSQLNDKNMKVIKDIKPRAKNHYLVIPRVHIESWTENQQILPEILFKILKKVRGTYRLEVNQGRPYREVDHCHVHILSDYGVGVD